MKTKKQEAQLIWEMYNSPEYYDEEGHMDEDFEMDMDEDFEIDSDGFDDDFGVDDQPEIVMSMEPMGETEPIGDSGMNEIMASELKQLAEYGKRLEDLCGKVEFDAWMVAKIVKASDYVSDIWHRLDSTGADFANTGFEQAPDYQNL
jgi:hypothetical protein